MSDNEIKNRILHAACEMFCEHGFSKATMEDLSQELGMSKKTLYQYFQSKEELLSYVLQMMRDETDEILRQHVEDDSVPFVVKLKRCLKAVSTQINKQNKNFISDISKNAPAQWKEMEKWKREKVRGEFKRLIQHGVESGVFRTGINVDLLVEMYAVLMQSVWNPSVVYELPMTSSQVHEMMTTIIFEGIFTDEARIKYHTTEAKHEQEK